MCRKRILPQSFHECKTPSAFFAPCAEAGAARTQNRETRAQATENCLRTGFLIYDTLSVRRSCSMRAPL